MHICIYPSIIIFIDIYICVDISYIYIYNYMNINVHHPPWFSTTTPAAPRLQFRFRQHLFVDLPHRLRQLRHRRGGRVGQRQQHVAQLRPGGPRRWSHESTGKSMGHGKIYGKIHGKWGYINGISTMGIKQSLDSFLGKCLIENHGSCIFLAFDVGFSKMVPPSKSGSLVMMKNMLWKIRKTNKMGN